MSLVSGNIAAAQRDILGLRVCDFGWAEAFALAETMATMPVGQNVIAFLNAANANCMMRDPEYRAVLERQIVLPDGNEIAIAARALRDRNLPENLTGIAFVPALLTYIARPMRIALVGGAPEALRRATEELRRHTPWHDILPISDGNFDAAQSDAVMERVLAAKADILLVAMGSPAQEKWIDRHVGPGHARLVLSVGGLFEALADRTYRAPLDMRRRRFDWLFRLLRAQDRALPLLAYHVLRHRYAGAAPERTLGGTAKAGTL